MQPTILERDAQPYVGRRETVAMAELAGVADLLPGMIGDLGSRGVPISGPPFLRYRVIDMAGQLIVEAGVPVDGLAEVGEPAFLDVLPAGRYVTATHVGPPDQLVAATAELLQWAQQQGLRWDVRATPTGEEWGCRLEIYATNPAEQPDVTKWETVLQFRLAD